MSDQAAPAQKGPDLHQLALDAEQSLEKLATGLAHAGVDPTVTDAVGKAADVARKVAQALGKGQERTGDNEPAAPEPQPAQQPPQRPTMDSAVHEVHQGVQQAAQQRRGY